MSEDKRMKELELRDSVRTVSQDNCPAQQKTRFTILRGKLEIHKSIKKN